MPGRSVAVTSALAALLVVVPPAAGQGLAVGGEAGLNLSDLDAGGTSDIEPESTTGFRIGAVVRLGTGSALGLQGGLHLSRAGARIGPFVTAPGGPGPDVPFNGELKLTRLEVPLVATVSLPTGSSLLEPRLYAGGRVAFETACELEGAGATRPCDERGPETAATTGGLLVGGGLDVELGPGSVTLDARYDHGLTDVIDDPEIELDEDDQSLRSVALTAGYVVRLP